MRGNREQILPQLGHSFRILRWSSNLREVELLLDETRSRRISGEGAHWHYHLEMELTHFTAGEGTRFAGDHIGPFAAGEVVLLGEKLPHYWHTQGSSAGLSVQWSFPPGHPFWAFPEMQGLSGLFKKAERGISYRGATAQAIAAGMRDLARTRGLQRLGGLMRLLGILEGARPGDMTLLSQHSFSLPTNAIHQQAISGAVRHLLAHFREAIALEDVLRLTRMSKPTFSRQFKKHSGKTFSQFIAQLRLQAACRELVETDRSVLEIALSCGFGQVSFFNRLFRRHLKTSPTYYRLQQRALAARRKV